MGVRFRFIDRREKGDVEHVGENLGRVEIEIVSLDDGGCELSLLHDPMVSVAAGWHTQLGILSDHLTGRQQPNFWVAQAEIEAEYERLMGRPVH